MLHEGTADRYRALFDVIPQGVVVYDRDGVITEANEAAAQILGVPPHELVGHDTRRGHWVAWQEDGTDFPYDRRPLAVTLATARAVRGVVVGFDRASDDTRRWLQVSSEPILDEGGAVVAAVLILDDITEQRAEQQQLRESRGRYRSLFESSPIAIWEQDYSALRPTLEMIDARTVQEYAEYFDRRPDLLDECIHAIRIIDANQAVVNMLGAADVDELTNNYTATLTRETVRGIGHGIALLATGWTVFDLTMPMRTMSGDVVQTMMRIQVAPGHEHDLSRVIISAMDIGELEEARDELVRANRMLEAILGSMDQAVMLYDSHRKILSCNAAAASMFGVSEEELIGSTARQFYGSEEEWERLGAQAKTALTEDHTFEKELTYTRPDGSEFLAELVASPLDRSAGWLGGVVAVIRDVTDSRALQEGLAQSRRLEAIGQLAGGIAHDFNNMLTVIIGNLGMALHNIDDTEEVREQVSQSLEAARRTAKLTGQLLAFSRRQVLAPEAVDLDETVRSLELILRHTIPENIELSVALAAPSPVLFDPAQIDQIVMDLVVHARDSMPDGGMLTIETAAVEFGEDDARPPEMQPGRYMRLSVEDTGFGMDPAAVGHVFEPFFTTKRVGTGSGLGLAAVYGIARQGGGGVEVRSAPDEGTRFDVYLPVAVEAPPVRPVERRPKLPVVGGGVTVLVAEDDPAVRRLVVSALQSRGYDVLASCSGAEARRLFDVNEAAVRLLITDVVMPGMSGAELARWLRERRADLPVLFISGYTGDVIDDHGLRDAGDRMLTKPFGPDDLASAVAEVLAGE